LWASGSICRRGTSRGVGLSVFLSESYAAVVGLSEGGFNGFKPEALN